MEFGQIFCHPDPSKKIWIVNWAGKAKLFWNVFPKITKINFPKTYAKITISEKNFIATQLKWTLDESSKTADKLLSYEFYAKKNKSKNIFLNRKMLSFFFSGGNFSNLNKKILISLTNICQKCSIYWQKEKVKWKIGGGNKQRH